MRKRRKQPEINPNFRVSADGDFFGMNVVSSETSIEQYRYQPRPNLHFLIGSTEVWVDWVETRNDWDMVGYLTWHPAERNAMKVVRSQLLSAWSQFGPNYLRWDLFQPLSDQDPDTARRGLNANFVDAVEFLRPFAQRKENKTRGIR